MELDRFDRLTRLFSVSTSRRAGLRALVIGAFIPITGGLSGEGAKARPARRDRLAAQGPCGNGGGRANRCKRHRDCCTGICQRVRPGKRKRCRCRRRNQRCTEDRNCCNRRGQNLVCHDGTCQRLTCGINSPCRVFLTSETVAGNAIGGLAGGDARCNQAAAAANLPGQYRAWLSAGDGISPASRFVPSSLPYILLDSAATPIANDWDDLIDGTLLARINVTEHADTLTDFLRVWTGTAANGSAGGANCTNWTDPGTLNFGRFGITTATDDRWSEDGEQDCGNELHLYCFEQPPAI